MDEYLKTLLEQIRCKKARPYVKQEFQFHYDTDHVPEQASVQQELRNGWCIIRIPVHYHRSAQPDRIPL